MKKKETNHQDMDSAKSSLISMVGSLIIVGLVLLFMVGFGIYLDHHTYHGQKPEEVAEATTQKPEKKEYLSLDKDFTKSYIMIKETPEDGFYANAVPGEKGEDSVQLESGQILKVTKRGTYQNRTYYELSDHKYVRANGKNVVLLKSYEKKTGYIAITYISQNGVHLRKWVDFDDDSNIVRSVYVGDKVTIKGKVVLSDGTSAYQTEEGLYVTTDTKYFKDFTA